VAWLLVEDDDDIRNIVSMMFTVWGQSPLVFPDGFKAWAWLDSVEQGTFTGTLPELALMDIRMPGHRGDEIAGRIRKTAAIKDIPIILMTAFSLTEAEITAMKADFGIDHILNKPLPDLMDFHGVLMRVRSEKLAENAARAANPMPDTAVAAAPVSITTPPPTSIEPAPQKAITLPDPPPVGTPGTPVAGAAPSPTSNETKQDKKQDQKPGEPASVNPTKPS
jgi:CheY-like chemotaxis protein